jgi:hypothetical protein
MEAPRQQRGDTRQAMSSADFSKNARRQAKALGHNSRRESRNANANEGRSGQSEGKSERKRAGTSDAARKSSKTRATASRRYRPPGRAASISSALREGRVCFEAVQEVTLRHSAVERGS